MARLVMLDVKHFIRVLVEFMAALVIAVDVNGLMMMISIRDSPFVLTYAETLVFVYYGFVSCTHELIAFSCVAAASYVQVEFVVM